MQSKEQNTVYLDYEALKRCMTEAIKDAMVYERGRREKAVVMYIVAMVLCGGLVFHMAASGKPLYEIGMVLAMLFATIQLCFAWWIFTRWL